MKIRSKRACAPRGSAGQGTGGQRDTDTVGQALAQGADGDADPGSAARPSAMGSLAELVVNLGSAQAVAARAATMPTRMLNRVPRGGAVSGEATRRVLPAGWQDRTALTGSGPVMSP